MAPKTNTQRFNLIHSASIRTGISLFLLVVLAFLPFSVSAAPQTDYAGVPDLSSFTSSIQNGDGNALRGVYVDGLFALPIVQQPSSNPAYVSTDNNTVTQFGMATQFGGVGLLAHNNLSGQYFFRLMPGMMIQLIFGNGQIEYFQVTQVYQYRATSPYSMYSDFVNLDTQEYLIGSALFAKVYTGPRHLTFQTCISHDGNSSWGRLFVIAEPIHYLSSVVRAN